MTRSEASDEELAARIGRGDRLAAAILIERHSDRLLGLAWRMLGERAAAEDVRQETFLTVWTHAAKWRPRGVKFEAWLYRVATNACLDRLRRRGRETTTEEPPEQSDPTPDAEESMINEDRRRAVDAALRALPERQRLAIVLCHYQELSNTDAAHAMQISLDALESLLARARRALRSALISQSAELMEGGRHEQVGVAV